MEMVIMLPYVTMLSEKREEKILLGFSLHIIIM